MLGAQRSARALAVRRNAITKVVGGKIDDDFRTPARSSNSLRTRTPRVRAPLSADPGSEQAERRSFSRFVE